MKPPKKSVYLRASPHFLLLLSSDFLNYYEKKNRVYISTYSVLKKLHGNIINLMTLSGRYSLFLGSLEESASFLEESSLFGILFLRKSLS